MIAENLAIAAARIGAAASRYAREYSGRPGECVEPSGATWLEIRETIECAESVETLEREAPSVDPWLLFAFLYSEAVDLLASDNGLCGTAGCGRVVVPSEGHTYCRACHADHVAEYRRQHAGPNHQPRPFDPTPPSERKPKRRARGAAKPT